MSHRVVQMAIEKRFGGQAILRQAIRKMGPVVTDNGNFLLDWQFESSRGNKEIHSTEWWSKVEKDILTMPGVVEIGLFVRMAERIYFGMQDGTIQELALPAAIVQK